MAFVGYFAKLPPKLLLFIFELSSTYFTISLSHIFYIDPVWRVLEADIYTIRYKKIIGTKLFRRYSTGVVLGFQQSTSVASLAGYFGWDYINSRFSSTHMSPRAVVLFAVLRCANTVGATKRIAVVGAAGKDMQE